MLGKFKNKSFSFWVVDSWLFTNLERFSMSSLLTLKYFKCFYERVFVLQKPGKQFSLSLWQKRKNNSCDITSLLSLQRRIQKEPCETFKMRLFAKIAFSIFDAWQSSEYVSTLVNDISFSCQISTREKFPEALLPLPEMSTTCTVVLFPSPIVW